MSEPPIDREIELMSELAIILEELTSLGPVPAARVLHWAFDRFGINTTIAASMIAPRQARTPAPVSRPKHQWPKPQAAAPAPPAEEAPAYSPLPQAAQASSNGRTGAPPAASQVSGASAATCPICNRVVKKQGLNGHMMRAHDKTITAWRAEQAAPDTSALEEYA